MQEEGLGFSCFPGCRMQELKQSLTMDAFLHSGSWVVDAILVHGTNPRFSWVVFFFFDSTHEKKLGLDGR